MRLKKFLLAVWLCATAGTCVAQTGSVAVAANLQETFNQIYAAFTALGKPPLKIVYGSSGNFTSQILSGAPFNLLVSADEDYPMLLFKNGKTVDAGKVYAIGKIAVIASRSSKLEIADTPQSLAQAIAKANKVAIAKPELAPYGKAAVAYLKAAGLWDLAKDKLVYADNIAMATMFVASGAADLGFTAFSLAQSPEVAKKTHYVLVSDRLYEPIKQRMVLMKNPPGEIVALYEFLQSPTAQTILKAAGYTVEP